MPSPYITKEGLKNLHHYKYDGVDFSLLSKYIMTPFWLTLSSMVPRWIAPSLLTFLGLAASISSYIALAYYSPSFSSPAPSWVYLLAAAALFWYQTMDALDGKQELRTTGYTAMGGLMDHSFDAMSTVLIALTYSCVVRLEAGGFLCALVLISCSAFYLAQWEEYETGFMNLGHINITEAQLMLCGVYLATYWFGSDFWVHEVSFMGISAPVNVLFTLFGMIGPASNIVSHLMTVAKHPKVKTSVAALHLIPLIVFVSGTLMWKFLSPSDISSMFPHRFYVTAGLVYSYVTARLIMNRVCLEYYSPFHPIELGYLVVLVYTLAGGQTYFSEYHLLMGFLLASFAQHVHFMVSVTNEISRQLGFGCFIMSKKAD